MSEDPTENVARSLAYIERKTSEIDLDSLEERAERIADNLRFIGKKTEKTDLDSLETQTGKIASCIAVIEVLVATGKVPYLPLQRRHRGEACEVDFYAFEEQLDRTIAKLVLTCKNKRYFLGEAVA
jgi:hypothetical protein